MTGSSDDINVDKVRAAIQKKRADSGATPAVGTPTPAKPDTDAEEDVDPEKVRAALRLTRACAIKNAQSSESLKEVQSATPGRGIPTSKFKTRGASPSTGSAAQASSSDAKQKKEKSP
jgi:hypothetical protein